MNIRAFSVTVASVALLLVACSGVKTTQQNTATLFMDQSQLRQIRNPMMPGVWRNDQDPKFTREFHADGAVIDAYSGDASATKTGTWAILDPSQKMTGVPAMNVAGISVLSLAYPDKTRVYFAINDLSDNAMRVTSLSSKVGMMTFTKIR